MSTSQPPTDATVKSLSKKTVYLPLAAYDNKVDGKYDPEAYMVARKSLPNSIQEKSLVEFWHKVGVEYHRTASVKEARNNGNKATSLADMEERIRSRAMTLVGGGYNTAWDNSNTSKLKPTASTQQLSRKRQTARKRIRESKHLMHVATKYERRMGKFVYEMNGLWNEYMHKLLHLPTAATLEDYQKFSRNAQLWSRVTAMITNETAQLVGARVQIKVCLSCPSWAGRIGYVVGKTKNTWSVMVSVPASELKTKRRRKKTNKSASTASHNAEEKQDGGETKDDKLGWKSLVVPKRGAVLSLLIPIQIGDEAEGKASASRSDVGPPETTSPILTIDIREDE